MLRCRLRNLSYTLSTKVGGETSIGRWQLEGIVKGRRARPRILWKPIDREKREASGVPDMFGRFQPEKSFFFKSGPHYQVVDSRELDPSIVHFHHDSSSTRYENEETVRMCRMKGTPNDRHQSGGQ